VPSTACILRAAFVDVVSAVQRSKRFLTALALGRFSLTRSPACSWHEHTDLETDALLLRQRSGGHGCATETAQGEQAKGSAAGLYKKTALVCSASNAGASKAGQPDC
jgi:hypothetical protein